jgi:3-(3-hydroxy-phenyl)propionate hydroxylase
MGTYHYHPYAYRTPPELGGAGSFRHRVVIVGAGPVGLAAAIDLAQRGIPTVVLDDNDVVSVGSRAICWSKRTLEIFDRIGVGARMVATGVTWQVGRVYHEERELYRFDLLPEGGHRMPAFINLQQYYVEEFLVDRALQFGELVDLRWKNCVVGVDSDESGVKVTVETPDGVYHTKAEWLIAADGARSAVRGMLGLPFEGRTFEEKFLIVDVRMNGDYPSDRRFWFRPAFDPGESVLIHRQPHDVFRVDFQLGSDADGDAEKAPERALARVRRVVGPDVDCEFEWSSVYTFRCARLDRFVHGRVIFAGDSAHLVSPFGARGGNGGVQDADNLCWKLAAVLRHEAPPSLLATYERERGWAADENILHSTRATTFITPKTAAERQLREAVLALAPEFSFARGLVNSGRLSKPASFAGFPGFAPDGGDVAGPLVPGSPCEDAPLLDPDGRPDWLLAHVGGPPTVLVFADSAAEAGNISARVRAGGMAGARVVLITPTCGAAEGAEVLADREGIARTRYGGEPGVTYLIRPDQHVLGRWAQFDEAQLAQSWQHCLLGGAA